MKEFSAIKKTLGKNGKYYHYESLASITDIKDVYWYRIDEPFFNYLAETYKDAALKIEYNNAGEIIYLEYAKRNTLTLKQTGVNNHSCSPIVIIFLLSCIIVTSLLIFIFI